MPYTRYYRPLQVPLIIAVFFALGFLIYGFSLSDKFVSLNTPSLVSLNPIVHDISWETFKDAFTTFDPELYIPFTFLSYQIDWALGNGTAYIFHLNNLILHILNALIVCWLMTLFSRNRWVGIVCGLVFLVHPINTETVLWISNRKDLLSTFFGRLTLLSYMYYVLKHRKKLLYASIVFFAFGLLSKVKVIMLPFIMLAIE